MSKSVFSASVTIKLNKVESEQIRQATLGSTELKKEMLKVFQQANRRAQNIEKSGVVSPAYQALVLEGRDGYSKFGITGLDLQNEYDWNKAKYEYSKAIEYLNNPTSSATGAKQYVKHIADKYDLPQDVASNIIRQATDTNLRSGKIPLMNYRSMIDEYVTDAKTELNTMNENSENYAKQLEENLQNASEQMADEINNIMLYYGKSLGNGNKLK